MKPQHKKIIKRIAYGLGIVGLLYLIGSFGFNYWLKNNLPEIVKKKSPYNVTYKSLNVEVATGDITAEDIKVSNKDPKNTDVVGLEGTIKSLKISNLGIWDALFHKVINSNDVTFDQPNLRITLAKPSDDEKTNKKKQPLLFENLHLTNGNIDLLKYNQDSMLSVKNLNLEVTNFRLTEKDVKQKLPVVFDSYSISGTDFRYRDDDKVYDVKAKKISTKNGQMSIQGFAATPLISQQAFAQRFPNKTNLFDVSAKEMTFKDISFKDNKVSLSKVNFDTPNIKVMATNGKNTQSKSNFNFDVELDNVGMQNGSILMLKPDGSTSLKLNQVKAEMNKIAMNDETSKGQIPFKYGNYRFETQNFEYSPSKYYKMTLGSVVIDNSKITLNDFNFLPTMSRPAFLKSLSIQEDLYTVKIPKIELIGYDYKNVNNKAQLTIKNVNVYNMFMNLFSYNGDKIKPDNTPRKFFSEKFRNIKLPFAINTTKIINSQLEYEETDDQATSPGKLTFANLNVNIDNLNSGKIAGHKTMVTVNGNTQFFKTSPTTVLWTFDVANPNDAFNFKANVNNLDASQINAFIKGYLHVSTTGMINNVNFDFKGDKTRIYGPFKMNNTNLKVQLLDKNTQEKKKLLSTVANWFIKKDSEGLPQETQINYARTEKRSFFNLLWRGMEQGLQDCLIGKKTVQKLKDVKTSVEDVKSVIKSDKPKKEKAPKEDKPKEKKGFLKGVFKKKEQPADSK